MGRRSKKPTGPLRAAVCVLACLVGACHSTGGRKSAALLPVPQPDLSGMEPVARAQVQASYSSLMAKAAASGLSAAELGSAFGETGRLLMAAEYHESAEPCFLDAVALSPDDARWTYYLGHLYKRKGDLTRAATYFERTITTQPNNVSALWWLGSIQLERGRAEEAEALFSKALSQRPDAWQTLYGLGRTALLRKDYTSAVQQFERTLAKNPRATAAHYQLGLAYRGLGKLPEAETHLRQRSDMEVLPPDPLMAELDALLQTSVAYHRQAVEAGKVGAWAKAVEYLRKATELDPQNARARLDLGVALYRTGSAGEAFEQIQQALRIDPRFARAHYAAGTLRAIAGHDGAAIEAFSAATTYDGSFVEAHIALAQALQRTGRQQEALAHYQSVLARVPADPEGQFGSAITSVRLGRYQEARAFLSQGMVAHPDETRFAHALARVLAAAPDDRIRDGSRARAMADALLKADATIGRAETLAMALAELGQFKEALEWQRQAIAAVERDSPADLTRMRANLRLYERGQPCRIPWPADDPIFSPAPVNPAP